MNNIKGMFIDDNKENYETYSRYLRQRNIEMVPFFPLPENISDIYKKIINENVDFIIIDKELGEQPVKYTGIDLLKSIRSQDAEIYIILLTNNDFGEDSSELGEFDQTIKKKQFVPFFEMFYKRLERGVSRDLSKKLEKEVEISSQQRQNYFESQLKMLRQFIEKSGK